MKKIGTVALLLIVFGVLAVAGATMFFHAYTYADTDVTNAAGDIVTPAGGIRGDWRDGEWTIYLGTLRTLVAIAGAVVVLGMVLYLVGLAKALKSHDIMVLILIALGTVTVLGFLTAFYPCTDMMAPVRLRPMRCVWTMRVLFGIAAAINVSGVLTLAFRRSKDFVKGLNTGVVMLGGLFVLIPTTLTGVCVVHVCVDGFFPFAVVMGAVMLTASMANAFLLNRKEEDD
ncbi:MAG: DUF4418 family protein [Treponema sp.]|nr:DUF4418 family protein [Treponema sp.]